MIIFLVGGSLRDRILGLKIVDNDWVIVGGIKNFLIKYKFFQVGKNFPIFIHPITKEEYSLARVEKKYHYGYKNFYINFNFFVTIEEDLYRPPQTRQGTPCHVRIIKTERPNASVCIPESLRGDNQNDRWK